MAVGRPPADRRSRERHRQARRGASRNGGQPSPDRRSTAGGPDLSQMEPGGRLAQGGGAVCGRRVGLPLSIIGRHPGIIVNITTSDQIMDDAISAADANRSFSSLLRRVREGRSVVVTSHGKPIARIVPLGERDDRAAEGARAALLARLRAEPVVNVGRWMRHDLYED